MVTVELCWSRVIAGAVVFSKETPDIPVGPWPLLGADLGAAGESWWERERAIHAGAVDAPWFARPACGDAQTEIIAVCAWHREPRAGGRSVRWRVDVYPASQPTPALASPGLPSPMRSTSSSGRWRA